MNISSIFHRVWLVGSICTHCTTQTNRALTFQLFLPFLHLFDIGFVEVVFFCWLQQYCNVHGTQSIHMEKDSRPCEGVSERERDSEKSQSYGVASAPRLTYQQWKTAVHDLTISIFLPSESRCFVQYYITIVDIGRSLFIIFTILVSTIKTISEGKRNTKERESNGGKTETRRLKS